MGGQEPQHPTEVWIEEAVHDVAERMYDVLVEDDDIVEGIIEQLGFRLEIDAGEDDALDRLRELYAKVTVGAWLELSSRLMGYVKKGFVRQTSNDIRGEG